MTLVQPPAGTSVPSDKPIVLFRFAAGEPGDPIDVGSFAITVDGNDRTPLFQVTATEAWGPLDEAKGQSSAESAGARVVAARVCSARGACATVSASITVAASPAIVAPEPASRRERLIDLLLRAVRPLLTPS